MIAAFTCAALFLVAYTIVGLLRVGLDSARHSRHDGRYVKRCEACWMELTPDERHAQIRDNINKARDAERIKRERERADFEARHRTSA